MGNPSAAAETDRGRLVQILAELDEALEVALIADTEEERLALYEQTAPLIQELLGFVRAPLPARIMTPLIHEYHWHLRCMVGVDEGHAQKDHEHVAFARAGLEKLKGAIPFTPR